MKEPYIDLLSKETAEEIFNQIIKVKRIGGVGFTLFDIQDYLFTIVTINAADPDQFGIGPEYSYAIEDYVISKVFTPMILPLVTYDGTEASRLLTALPSKPKATKDTGKLLKPRDFNLLTVALEGTQRRNESEKINRNRGGWKALSSVVPKAAYGNKCRFVPSVHFYPVPLLEELEVVEHPRYLNGDAKEQFFDAFAYYWILGTSEVSITA